MAIHTADGKRVSTSHPVVPLRQITLTEDVPPPFGVKAKRRLQNEEKRKYSFSDCKKQSSQSGRTEFLVGNLVLFSVKDSEVVLHDPDGLLAAMEYCQQNSANGFIINGSEEFKQRCAELALKHDFKIMNPEVQAMMNDLRRDQQSDVARDSESPISPAA